jgi:hypothetical protein
MGYYMQQVSAGGVHIPKDKFQDVLKAIQSLHGKETITDSGGKHFSWVDYNFYNIDNLKEMLEEWRWKPVFDDKGDIVKLEFWGEKIGDENLLFNAIAPCVTSGGYIQMMGEDHSEWRWVFEDGKCSDVSRGKWEQKKPPLSPADLRQHIEDMVKDCDPEVSAVGTRLKLYADGVGNAELKSVVKSTLNTLKDAVETLLNQL